jgi:hypothetical protein
MGRRGGRNRVVSNLPLADESIGIRVVEIGTCIADAEEVEMCEIGGADI